MASVNVDSELMRQHVAAVPVPDSSDFYTLRDERGLPLLFSLGNNGVLYAFKENDSGARVLINMSDALGISGKEALTFDVVQDLQGQIYYCFAYSTDGGDDATLGVCRPFHPSLIDEDSTHHDLRHLIIPEQGDTSTRISRIFLGPKHPRQSYPAVMLGYVPLDSVHKSADIGRVSVKSTLSSWKLESDVELPENARQIVDFCPAALPVGVGYFVLYVIQGQNQLVFATTPNSSGFSWKVALDPPSGSRCMSTVLQSNGYTGLLVGGEGLYYWTPTECQVRNHPGRRISNDESFDGIRQLYVAQSPALVSIFSSNVDDAVSYATTTDATFAEPLDAVDLIPEGQGGSMSPFIASDGSVQQMIIAGEGNKLSLLQQDTISGLWRTSPFYIPSLDENIEFDAFMARMSVLSATKDKLVTETLLLKSPEGWVEVLVNGRTLTVGPDGVPVMTDESGTLTLVIPSDDISSYQFQLTDVGEGFPAHFNGKVVDIDPAAKVDAKLATLNSAKDLREAKLENGQPLLKNTTASDEDIDECGKAMGKLNEQRENIASGKARKALRAMTVSRDARVFQPGRVRTGQQLGQIVGGFKTQRIANAQRIKDRGWDWWHGFWNGVRKIHSMVIEVIGDTVMVVIELVDEVIRLAVQTLQELGKVFAMIWDKILDILEDIKQWLSFLFNWGDIMDAKNNLKRMANNTFDAVPIIIDGFGSTFDGLFDQIEDMVDNLVYGPEVLKAKAGKDTVDDDSAEEGNEISNSSSAQYSNYQLDHGGATAYSTPANRDMARQPDFVKTMDHFIKARGATSKEAADLGESIKALFTGKGKVSGAEVGQQLASTVLKGILGAVKGIMTAGLTAVKEFIKALKEIVNFKIHIPVFSALYKKLTGSDLTLLDGLCLIIAIPLTVVTKVISGKKFPDLRDVNIAKIFAQGGFGFGLGGRELALTKSGMAAKVDRPPLEWNEAMSIGECVIRIIRAVLTVIKFKTRPVARLRAEGIETSLTVQEPAQTKPNLTEKQALQLRKFQAPHPLQSVARAGVGARAGVEARAGVPALLLNPNLWDAVLAVLGLFCTAPIDLTEPPQALRVLSWLDALIFEVVDFNSNTNPAYPDAPQDKIWLRCLNWAFVVVISMVEMRDDDERSFAALRLFQSLVDLGSGIVDDLNVADDWKLKAASVALDAVSIALLIGLTIKARKEKHWNYMLCDV